MQLWTWYLQLLPCGRTFHWSNSANSAGAFQACACDLEGHLRSRLPARIIAVVGEKDEEEDPPCTWAAMSRDVSLSSSPSYIGMSVLLLKLCTGDVCSPDRLPVMFSSPHVPLLQPRSRLLSWPPQGLEISHT